MNIINNNVNQNKGGLNRTRSIASQNATQSAHKSKIDFNQVMAPK